MKMFYTEHDFQVDLENLRVQLEISCRENTTLVIYPYSVKIIMYYNNNIAKITMYLIITITTNILFANSKYIGFLSDI